MPSKPKFNKFLISNRKMHGGHVIMMLAMSEINVIICNKSIKY